jgi:hypothetical protein
MRKLSVSILALLFIVACADKRPSDILPKDKMQEVMWDMLKAGEFLEAYVFNLNHDTSFNKASETAAWYEQVYRLHNITKAQFEKSYVYYRNHPALMKEMLDTLGKRDITKPVTDKANVADSAAKPVIDTTRPADPVRDSAFKRLNTALPGDTLSLPGKRRMHIIDSIKRNRLLQRKQRQEQ